MFEEINDIVDVLKNGGVVLYPTDTIWGLGCDATNEAAVAKIYKIKQRALNKSMIILVPDAKSIFQYVANPYPDIVAMLKSFNEPTTVIYDSGVGLADNVLATDGSIGIRVAKDEFCNTIMKRLKKPIVSTSANISGHQSPQFFKDIDPILLEMVDYVVQYRQDDLTPHAPSSIVKIDQNGQIQKIR